MLLRCMSLLMESKQVWPLASRWLESLERFSRDPKAATVSMDGGMADGVRLVLIIPMPPFREEFADTITTVYRMIEYYGLCRADTRRL